MRKFNSDPGLKSVKRIIPALMLLGLLYVAGCSDENTSESRAGDSTAAPDKNASALKQEVYSFKVEGFNKDKKMQWNLEGESAHVVKDKINIHNLRAIYYGDDAVFTVLADKAVYDKKTQNVELRSNIIARSSDGGELITDYAVWNPTNEEIKTDAHVVVKRENIICKGTGLITRPKMKWAEFAEEIEVNFNEGRVITCNGPFTINHEEHIAIFNNNVKVRDEKSDMFTDKLTVFLNPDTNEVESIVTEGNVEVVHRGNIEDLDKITF